MAEGLVTFFKHKHLGFYQKGTDYSEPLDITYLLDNLLEWYASRTSLADTLLWDDQTAGYQNRKKVYLKSIEKNEETGDFILILWRAIGSGDGVYGLRSDAPLGEAVLYDADDATGGDDVIWGEALYYWFAPKMDVFASIKFSRSVADTDLLNRYLRDFVCLHGTVKPKVAEEREGKHGMYTSVSFPSANGVNLWLRISSQRFTKLTESADLERIASEITHFVKRETISATEMQTDGWSRLCGTLPFISSETNRDTRRIEITVDASPTSDELVEMMEIYGDEYSLGTDDWVNLGFKKEGVGGVCWLNQFVVKNILVVSDIGSRSDDSCHYSSIRLFNALHLNRDRLLAPIGSTAIEYAVAS